MSQDNLVHDVFVSYAHADDEIQLGAEAGWVTTFVDELKKILRRKLGGSGASIWMDHQLAANDQVTATLLDTIARSKILILFMSPGYTLSPWCQKELGNFLAANTATKNKDNVFIVELDLTARETWHPRLQELTPIRFWREGRDQVTQLLGWPVPTPDPDDPYWVNLNKLAHIIADCLKKHLNPSMPIGELTKPHPDDSELPDIAFPTNNKVVWIAEPTDDLIDQWEALAEALRQAGAEIRPLGLDTYPRTTEADFLASVQSDLNCAHLYIQLLSQVSGRHPKDSERSFTGLQSAQATASSHQLRYQFLQWRNRDLNLANISDIDHKNLLTGAIACGFEEFRQRVLTTLQNLSSLPAMQTNNGTANESLAICISAHKNDYELGLKVQDILVNLGADALTTQTEPAQNQSPTEFNSQFDEIISNSEGIIIVYGRTPPAWVQAQYMRARKALAQKQKGLWSALLDGPPEDKPSVGLAGKNLMTLECRHGKLDIEIERFVNSLREESHA